ncbi:hypothetical protein [Streptomyces sp. NPDC055085]
MGDLPHLDPVLAALEVAYVVPHVGVEQAGGGEQPLGERLAAAGQAAEEHRLPHDRQGDAVAAGVLAEGDRVPDGERFHRFQGRGGGRREVGVVVGDPHRDAASVAAVSCTDAAHDDLDLVNAELGGDRGPLGEDVGRRLPATARQVEDDGPAVAVAERAHHAVDLGPFVVALALLEQAGGAQGVVELLGVHGDAQGRGAVVEDLRLV